MRGILVLSITALVGCGSGGVSTSTAVQLDNATAHATLHGTCTPPGMAGSSEPCTVYEITFSVANGARQAIDRVGDVQLSTGGQPLMNMQAIGCNSTPWTLGSGAMSGVITVDVTFSAHPWLQVQCDGGYAYGEPDRSGSLLLQSPGAPGDSFDLRVEGLLSDAQPFVATANAPIR